MGHRKWRETMQQASTAWPACSRCIQVPFPLPGSRVSRPSLPVRSFSVSFILIPTPPPQTLPVPVHCISCRAMSGPPPPPPPRSSVSQMFFQVVCKAGRRVRINSRWRSKALNTFMNLTKRAVYIGNSFQIVAKYHNCIKQQVLLHVLWSGERLH